MPKRELPIKWIADFQMPIADWSLVSDPIFYQVSLKTTNQQLAIENRQFAKSVIF